VFDTKSRGVVTEEGKHGTYASAVLPCEIATLTHKRGDYSMKRRSFVMQEFSRTSDPPFPGAPIHTASII